MPRHATPCHAMSHPRAPPVHWSPPCCGLRGPWRTCWGAPLEGIHGTNTPTPSYTLILHTPQKIPNNEYDIYILYIYYTIIQYIIASTIHWTLVSFPWTLHGAFSYLPTTQLGAAAICWAETSWFTRRLRPPSLDEVDTSEKYVLQTEAGVKIQPSFTINHIY